MDTKKLSFDEGLARLEAVLERLENGGLGLEEALKCYEEGVKLSASLQQQLDSAQRKVEVLRQGLGGEYTAEPLAGDSE